MQWQIVEKDDFGTDWALVRYDLLAVNRFDDEVKAMDIACKYLTDRNCNNALTKMEKRASVEAYMMTGEGCFLGILDNEKWFMTYPKDIKNATGAVIHTKNDNVTDNKWFELEGKVEVKVRPVPGT